MDKTKHPSIHKGQAMTEVPFRKTHVLIDYTNYRGERRHRVITPIKLTWGESEYHKGNQWLLLAIDCETIRTKKFAMKDIHSWQPQPPEYKP
jgi:predicted DNA-binding transcriptional regulator YafY